VFFQALLVKIVNEILFGQCAFGEPWNNRLGSRSQMSALKKDRDLDHAQAMGRPEIAPELGEVLTHYHHIFNRTDTTCQQIKMGMVAYLGGDHHMFNKIDTTCQQVNLGMVAYLGAVYDHSMSSGHPGTEHTVKFTVDTIQSITLINVQICMHLQSSKYYYDTLYHHHIFP